MQLIRKQAVQHAKNKKQKKASLFWNIKKNKHQAVKLKYVSNKEWNQTK